jgi:hypothetical protein
LSLSVFFREVQTASASRIAEIAVELLAQARHARDDTLWVLILARWSQVDPAKAARFALGLPNAQSAIGTFIRDLARHNLDAALAVANCQESPPDPFFLKEEVNQMSEASRDGRKDFFRGL